MEFFQQHVPDTNSASLKNGQTSMEEEILNSEKQLMELQYRKKQLLQEIDDEIAKERENWQKEKASYIEQANKEGYEVGFAQGKEASLAKYEEKINQANLIIKSAQKDYYSVVEQSEQKIIDLAMYTAKKIINKELAHHENSFLPIVTKVMEEIKDQPSVIIYLHPNNYEIVLKEKDELSEILDGDTKVEIYIDHQIKENGCLIKHSFGEIDASVDTQLDKIHDVLNEVSMENSKNEPS